jgi:hypothetical protein
MNLLLHDRVYEPFLVMCDIVACISVPLKRFVKFTGLLLTTKLNLLNV